MLKNKVSRERLKLKSSYFRKKWDEANNYLKKQRNVINSRIRKKQKVCSIERINLDGNIIHDNIVHEFNKYFCNVGHSVIVDINNELSRMGTSLFSEICYTGCLFLRPVTELEISNVIDNLKKNAAPGHDGICVNDLFN